MFIYVFPSKKKYPLTLLIGISVFLFSFCSCSNQKNTSLTRAYHSINTRYNAHFNAEEAYKEALKMKEESTEDNLSELLNIYPNNSDTTSSSSSKGDFSRTIDKTTKAIKLHSIKTKPKRDPKKRNDAEYQAWVQQKEFNPFLKNTWLLLAKGEFQSGDYIRAISTFMYISKIYGSRPEIVTECQLWIARAYTEMGWMYEAANVLHKLNIAGSVPQKHEGLYASVYANYLIQNSEYEKALPYLETAIKKEKSRHQRLRLRYLLGQLHIELNNNELARQIFSSIPGMNTPYKYSLSAKLQSYELVSPSEYNKAIQSLKKMTKGSKNEEYLDQIYYTIGSIYIHQSDTINAVDNFKKAVELSTRNGYDKTISQIALGDIYFNQREYILSQPAYQGALGQLNKQNKNFQRVSLRSEVLDELVVHVKTVEEQDSLQYVSKLPEKDRIELIEKIIADINKKEEEKEKEEKLQQKMQERENSYTDWNSLSSETLFDKNTPQVSKPISSIPSNESASFYFYSKQAVDQGKISFQKQWGNRKLEDNWRRRDKAISTFDEVDDIAQNDSIEKERPHIIDEDSVISETSPSDIKVSEDIYSIDYYLQRLPFTEEEIKESNDLIDNALFNMGLIYRNKLEDSYLAIDAFETNLSRFPQTPNKEEIYYQLFLTYMQLNNKASMDSYRNKLIGEFTDGKYTNPLSDDNYEWNYRHFAIIQDSLYEATYNAYREGDVKSVRNNYQTLQTKYPFGNLMSNFSFLNALSYAQTYDGVKLRDNLKELVETYPKSDVTPLATDILERIKDGKVLLVDGSTFHGIDWSDAFKGDSTLLVDSVNLQFIDSLDSEFMILLAYKEKTIDRNELLYQVADYNFSNYLVHTFDLNIETHSPLEFLQISGFDSFAIARSYINKAFGENSLIDKLENSITVIPISVANNKKLVQGLTLDNYLSFYRDHYTNQLPLLISHWDKKSDNLDYTIDEDQISPEEAKEDPIIAKTEETKPLDLDIKPIEYKGTSEKKEVPGDDKTITADDLLTQDQLQTIGKANDILESAEDILSNPVDGLKGLFKKFKENKNLTKEEKEALKEEKRLEKERTKELKAIQKAQQDSIRRIEKIRQDSTIRAEKALLDSLYQVEEQEKIEKKRIEQERKEAIKSAAHEKENVQKAKEQERKLKEQQQKERKAQRERDRKEKLKEQEKIRKEREKQLKDRRKQK